MSYFSNGNFDASNVDPTGDFEPIPEGQYKVVVKEIGEKPTKDGKGLGLNVKFEVIQGPHAKRTVFNWINLRNPSKQAEEIGQRELAALCHATGIMRPRSAQEFAGKMLTVEVSVVRDDRNGGLQNKVKRVVLPPKGNQASGSQQPPAASQAPAAAPQEPQPAATGQDDPAPWG